MLDESLVNTLDLRELGGVLQNIRAKVRSGVNTAVFTSNIAERIHIAWGLDAPILFVVSDRVKAREFAQEFEQYEDEVSLLVERDDMLMYRKLAVGVDITSRLRALYDFITGKSRIMVATSEALMQYFPTLENIKKSLLQLEVDGVIAPQKVLKRLVEMGYIRVDSVMEKGDFSMVGDILSVDGRSVRCRRSPPSWLGRREGAYFKTVKFVLGDLSAPVGSCKIEAKDYPLPDL